MFASFFLFPSILARSPLKAFYTNIPWSTLTSLHVHPKHIFFSCSYDTYTTFPLYLTVSFFWLSYFLSPSFLLYWLTVFSLWKGLISVTLSEKGGGWDEEEKAECKKRTRRTILHFSSVYSKHFTGNCCRHATDRRKGRQKNTHIHKKHSLHLYCFSWKSGSHHWIEKENTRRSESAPKSPSHSFLMDDTCQIKSEGSNAKWCTFSFSEWVSAAFRDVLSSRHNIYTLPGETFLCRSLKCLSSSVW